MSIKALHNEMRDTMTSSYPPKSKTNFGLNRTLTHAQHLKLAKTINFLLIFFILLLAIAHLHTQTYTDTHTHTDTQTHRHTDTQNIISFFSNFFSFTFFFLSLFFFVFRFVFVFVFCGAAAHSFLFVFCLTLLFRCLQLIQEESKHAKHVFLLSSKTFFALLHIK